nr:hypothetical protein CFP56_69332 [Quercus suber]
MYSVDPELSSALAPARTGLLAIDYAAWDHRANRTPIYDQKIYNLEFFADNIQTRTSHFHLETMADDAAAKDNAAKARIINHMNADHHDSVIRYLEHYCHLPSRAAYDGRMNGVDLNGMSFVCQSKLHRVAFTPPLTSYRDVRERVVEMDKICRSALGRSEITVSEFVPPTGLNRVPFVAVVATFLGYSQRWWFGRGEVVERVLGAGFAAFSWRIQPWLFWGMVVVHSAEAVYFAMGKLRRHSVNSRSAVWWKWVIFTFVEGFFATLRFDRLVKAKRDAKEKQKH